MHKKDTIHTQNNKHTTKITVQETQYIKKHNTNTQHKNTHKKTIQDTQSITLTSIQKHTTQKTQNKQTIQETSNIYLKKNKHNTQNARQKNTHETKPQYKKHNT